MLCLFWKEVYDSLLIGENERVPFIRHDYSRYDWEAIARVLLKGYRMCQYLPLLVSKTFMSYVLFGESSISDPSILTHSFFRLSPTIYQGFRHVREAINLCQIHQWF